MGFGLLLVSVRMDILSFQIRLFSFDVQQSSQCSPSMSGNLAFLKSCIGELYDVSFESDNCPHIITLQLFFNFISVVTRVIIYASNNICNAFLFLLQFCIFNFSFRFIFTKILPCQFRTLHFARTTVDNGISSSLSASNTYKKLFIS